MSSDLKFLILFSVVCLVTSSSDSRDNEPFNSWQGIKDNFHVGSIKGKTALCTTRRQGIATQGVCKPLGECLQQGGTSGGSCGLLGTCCLLESTCTEITSDKVAYFISPQNLQPQCSLTVNVFNTDVCQIRLDFEQFSIEQPSRDVTHGLGLFAPYECSVDAFTVTGATGILNLGFVHLCGQNTNQHIYVPVNSTAGLRFISLNFQLESDRVGSPSNPNGYINPTWRIRITQLECQVNAAANFNNLENTLFSTYQRFNNKQSDIAQSDTELIAPSGCLQYNPDKTGTYETFNYNSGIGPYIANLNYAICFRRHADNCGISHTPVTFRMNSNPALGICRSSVGANEAISSDYIIIPGGLLWGSNNPTLETSDIFCDQYLNATTTVISAVGGPFFVAVRTDEFVSGGDAASESGFRITYAILNRNCGILYR